MLASLKSPKLIVADTMNLWIQTERNELAKLLKQFTAWCSMTAKRAC